MITFGAELRYVKKTIPNVNQGPYNVWEWVEVKPAGVPESLTGKVESIRVADWIYLSD